MANLNTGDVVGSLAKRTHSMPVSKGKITLPWICYYLICILGAEN